MTSRILPGVHVCARMCVGQGWLIQEHGGEFRVHFYTRVFSLCDARPVTIRLYSIFLKGQTLPCSVGEASTLVKSVWPEYYTCRFSARFGDRQTLAYAWLTIMACGLLNSPTFYSTVSSVCFRPGVENWQDHWVPSYFPVVGSVKVNAGDTVQLKVTHSELNIMFEVLGVDPDPAQQEEGGAEKEIASEVGNKSSGTS